MEKIDKGEEKNLIGAGWIKLWILFDVQSNDKDYAIEALREHVSKMKDESMIRVVDENFADVSEVTAPHSLKLRGVNKMYSCLYEAIIFVKGFESLVNFVMNYAPTAIEVLAPDEIKLKASDIQNALVSIADLLHKYAQAGLGGVVISK